MDTSSNLMSYQGRLCVRWRRLLNWPITDRRGFPVDNSASQFVVFKLDTNTHHGHIALGMGMQSRWTGLTHSAKTKNVQFIRACYSKERKSLLCLSWCHQSLLLSTTCLTLEYQITSWWIKTSPALRFPIKYSVSLNEQYVTLQK